ncbi:MAG: hypothetical protein J6H18_05685 [Lachnospiraceae bacterium]|nr:hypothetical protein [Lachnospiraceae bacterium]
MNRIRISLMLTAGMLAFALLFRMGKTKEGLVLLLLGAVGAAAAAYLPIQRKKEEEEKRRQELTREYSQLLTMLSLYMAAGLSLRSSWERLVQSYEKERKSGGREKAVYEEMLITWKDMKGGEFEDRAYGAFGRRCGTSEYLRLGGMLETFVHHGNKELLSQLEQEAAASLAMALQNVKKTGEKTGTKLLLPIFLLFGLSLLLVMVPALMSMKVVTVK